MRVDLHHAEEASALAWRIGQHAARINQQTFGAFFGSAQIIFGRYQVLSVARMFEAWNKRYVIRSIPSALTLMDRHSETLQVQQRAALENHLVELGAQPSSFDDIADAEFTRFVVDFFRTRLAEVRVEGKTGCEIVKDICAIRNKLLAHHEHIDSSALAKPTYTELDTLIDYAREFVCSVGFGYFSVTYTGDSGKHLLDDDTRKSTICLDRILKRIGVVDDDV